MPGWDVVGLGAVSVDFYSYLEQLPQPGQKVRLPEIQVYDGGLVGTALVAVSRLGGKAAYLGRLGFSPLAERAISQLSREGVDISLVRREAGCEPHVALVLVHPGTGERTILYTKQRVRYPVVTMVPEGAWTNGTRCFLIDAGSGPEGLQFAQAARRHGIPVVLDIEKPGDLAAKFLEAADHLVVPESFAHAWTGLADPRGQLRGLARRDEQTVVVTRGEKGLLAREPGGAIFDLPAYTVVAVDTTGCGDVFHGAYALGVARGWNLERRCRIAAAAAALAATRPGGRAGIPDSTRLAEFLAACGEDTALLT
ncbi:MAG: sugar kinase [Acidobacteriota bacterium]